MKESNHRTMNSLQSIAALLDIQLMDNEQTIPAAEMAHVRGHIQTLASLHELLVFDVNGHKPQMVLSAKAALEKLLPLLQKTVGNERIAWEVADVNLPAKEGMSLAVLINELVTNAVKHGGHKVELSLGISEGVVTLAVCDDGPGFAEAFHLTTAAHFGLELVESIGRIDLGGRTSYSNLPGGGACVEVNFPLPVEAAA